jgi:hypothetical protein
MKKATFQFSLPMAVLKEKKRYVAYTPALDLSTSGRTQKMAQKRFVEATIFFFEECMRKGTLDEVLDELGWQKVKKEWKPPVVVSQQSEMIRVPIHT